MKASIVECLVGVFAFDEENMIVGHAFFSKESDKIAAAVRRIQEGEVIEEVASLIRNLMKKGYSQFVFENDGLARNVKETFGAEIIVENPSRAGEELRSNMGKIVLETGYISDIDDFYRLVHDVSMALAKGDVQQASGKKDLLIIQSILALDDLDKALNLFANRLREWYGLHFPELSSLIEKNDVYLRLIASLSGRSSFEAKNLVEEGLTSERAEVISDAAKNSMGAVISERDMTEIRSLAKAIYRLYDSRSDLEKYLDEIMKEAAPNIYDLVGSTLGARLIATAGGLKGLAKRAASTIQVLGAEKALFRSIRTGTRPPKHGLIFQHKDVHQSPRWQRGKIARALAGKLAIAARLDAYGGEYKGVELKADFEERLKEIKEKYAEAPKKKEKESRGNRT